MRSSKLPTLSSVMTVMTRGAIKASRGLLRDFSELEHLQISHKKNDDFVTNADINANKIIKEELLKARPGYGFLSEELDEIIGDGEYRWIVDPLDGTVNFMNGFPHWAISISLEDMKTSEIVAGMTYDPVKNEMFCTEKGRGAFLNDRRLRVSKKTSVKDSLIAFREMDDKARIASLFASGIRKTGCTTLNFAYTAAGRFNAYILGKKSIINPWDYSAGVLLLKEAGGVLINRDGKVVNNLSEANIATSIDLIPSLCKIFSK